jgi:23S rRNA (guanosine2251-2'-O)-methyltransferase
MNDSEEYRLKKAFFADLLTIFGRKPVAEALDDEATEPFRLHLAETNKTTPAIEAMIQRATQRGAEVCYHSRDALSRISKNRRQDQGVVLDIKAPNYRAATVLEPATHPNIIALENVTNPQNIGMAIRSVGASPSSGILLARQGNAPLDGLVIKSSAGALFKSPVFHCDRLEDTVDALVAKGYRIFGLTGAATMTLAEVDTTTPSVFILGNETTGLSQQMLNRCHEQVKVPMNNGVESLNVSVTAALVAFRDVL